MKKVCLFMFVISFLILLSCDEGNVNKADSKDNLFNNDVIVNPYGAIVLTCDDFKDDITLEDDPSKAVDYIIDCLVDVDDIEIEIIDGAVVEFTIGSGIIFNGNSRLSFYALPGVVPPVILRGNKSEKGYWKGIHINSDQGSNIMNGVEIHDAGSTSDADFYGAITISGGCDIINVVVNNSANYGIYYETDLGVWNDLSTAEITNCSSYPIRIGANNVGVLFGYSEFTTSNNNPNRILVATEEITNQEAFYDRGIPYEINGIITATEVLRIEDGAELAFNPESRIIINKQISAWADSDNPIYLYGLERYAGSWQGIYINCSNPSTSNRIENVYISDGGEETYGSGNLTIESGKVILNDCRITNSRTCGVRIDLANGELVENNNYYADNLTGNVCEE